MSFPRNPPSGSGASRLIVPLLLLCALVVPSGAFARDRVRVIPKFTMYQEYQSNAIRRSSLREHHDFVTRVRPGLTLESEGETGHVRLEVSLPSRIYARFSELNSVDQNVRIDVERLLSRRLEFFTTGSFYNSDDHDPLEIEDRELNSGSDSTVQSLTAGFRYRLTPRGLGQLAFSYADSDFGEGRRGFDRSGLDLSYIYTLSPRDSLTMALSYQDFSYEAGRARIDRVRSFGPANGIPFLRRVGSQDQQIAAAQGTWTRAWSPRWTSTFRLGARRLADPGTRELLGPYDVRSGAASSVGLIGGALLRRQIRNGHIEFRLDQETRPSSGRGTSLDIRTWIVTFDRRLAPRWSFRATALSRQYESASEGRFLFAAGRGECGSFGAQFAHPSREVCSLGSQGEIETDTVAANLMLTWQMRRNWTTIFGYDYVRQDDRSINPNSYKDHRVRIGFNWFYDIDVP